MRPPSSARYDHSYPVFLGYLACITFWIGLIFLAMAGGYLGFSEVLRPDRLIDVLGMMNFTMLITSPYAYFLWLTRDDAAFARNFPRLHKRFGKKTSLPDYPLVGDRAASGSHVSGEDAAWSGRRSNPKRHGGPMTVGRLCLTATLLGGGLASKLIWSPYERTDMKFWGVWLALTVFGTPVLAAFSWVAGWGVRTRD